MISRVSARFRLWYLAPFLVLAAIISFFFASQPAQLDPRPGPKFEPARESTWLRPIDGATRKALQRSFIRVKELNNAQPLTISIATASSGSWSAIEPENAGNFWWASVGKLVTTVLVLQEVEAGHLDLDAAVITFLPDLENLPDGVTLRHLLTHTSGIPDFGNMGLLQGRFGSVDRDELMGQALGADVDFDAGEAWHYSNTGFLVLQEVLEAIHAAPYSELVQTQIASSLGLANFQALDGEVPVNLSLPDLQEPRPASEYPSNIGGAGNIIATAQDMAVFWQATMSGQLVDPEILQRALSDLYPVFGSDVTWMGAGIVVFSAADDNGIWIGHSGGADQVGALVSYSPQRQMVIAVAGIGKDFHAFDVADVMIETMDNCEANGC